MPDRDHLEHLIQVQERILRDAFADQDEKRIALADTMNQILVHVATLAETGRQNVWLNRLLVAALIVLAGAEKVFSLMGGA